MLPIKKICILFFLSLIYLGSAMGQKQSLNILIFSKTNGYRHASIEAGIQGMQKMCIENHWRCVCTEDSMQFTLKNLLQFDIIVFLNTSGDILNRQQQDALRMYFEQGGGFIGVHTATATETGWNWYMEMIGAKFQDHPKVQKAKLLINKNIQHPAIQGLSPVEWITDEWYNFENPVAAHVNEIIWVDEESYEGGKMGNNHPIAWYHYYDGGRVFYTALGHNNEEYENDHILMQQIKGAILWAGKVKDIPVLSSSEWKNLINNRLQDNWDVITQKATGISGEDQAVGLGNNKNKEFSLKTIDGEKVIHVKGETNGALSSKQEFENYHLSMQLKLGSSVGEEDVTENSGILYHCSGRYRNYRNVWMASHEFEIQKNTLGSYFSHVNTAANIKAKYHNNNRIYSKNGKLQTFTAKNANLSDSCKADTALQNEILVNAWNTLELICYRDTCVHIVNGRVVMVIENSRFTSHNGQIKKLQRGKIQLQSNGAEVFFKNIKIKALNEIPHDIKTQMDVE